MYFQEGWHGNEGNPETLDTWRWSTEQGSLALRNPGSDAVLYLELDGRPELFERPQQVSLSVGDETLYELQVDSPERSFHEIPISARHFGERETLTISVNVDPTFVPARVPDDASADARTLGVRVFYAFLEPR